MKRTHPASALSHSVCLLAAVAVSTATPAAAGPHGHERAVSVAGEMRALVEADWIDRDRRFVPGVSDDGSSTEKIATGATAGVTTRQDAAGGCDGVKTGRFGFHTASREQDPWWQVDLGEVVRLDRVVIYNRTDAPPERTRHIRILVDEQADGHSFRPVYQHDGVTFHGFKEQSPLVVRFDGRDVTARIVRLQVPGRCSFALDEVEVYAANASAVNLALGKPADQKSTSPYSHPGTKGHEYRPPEVPKPPREAFSLAHTREVIRRGNELAARLQFQADPKRLEPPLNKLRELSAGVAKLEASAGVPQNVRRELYLEAQRLVRRIAFSNRLLDLDRILFIKRHDPGGLYHMVHQYYGFGAVPGGGLFVLRDPFSSEPKLVDLLADTVVENGRLKGNRLLPGVFLSPELSYDAKTILFAYTEAKGEKPEWSPRSSYHIFRVGADGTGLVQLTDGTWNDFDPCFLPNGRIVFVSERRGGYLRCGGSAPPWDSPTYTLFSMEPDGGDVVCLSFHETHEWLPSVDSAGMLVYARWDYVDRDTNVAHHLWNCFPDGRDPRSYHGNYPQRRENRPWMEMSPRSVPGSHKLVATAAAHHGHAFGSLVLIDYRPEDDGAVSQIERITPDVPFPESEGGKALIRQRMAYGTAWPLSEDDYLCVYDREATNHGIYWVDRFGNKELLYRDPSIPCLSPIPLRPRKMPPILPERTTQTAAVRKLSSPSLSEDGPATIALLNVYDSDFEWPPETEITALRIIQVLPKTTPPLDLPRIGIGTETNARAVLGTVPVEADGSAYFEAPVGRLIYFQALDQRGMAVQSMRSGTYVHPGERLVCQGCHERKHTPPNLPSGRPAASALSRRPSKIRPDVEGSRPFNYPRLVQPVLDRHCVDCHRKEDALDLSGTIAGQHGWTRSYASLAGPYGFYFTVSNGSINAGVHGGSRTTAGEFGARASKLLDYLDERHYGVHLGDEDFHRITLWLDCNSEFYGSYHDAEAQARGEVVWPTLD